MALLRDREQVNRSDARFGGEQVAGDPCQRLWDLTGAASWFVASI
jgi:hypothetical protein